MTSRPIWCVSSLANLYLHGFVAPQIHEYDTLTSEQRWQERADVILANPPFMSPKGGIRPHSRFSVQSKRSEVLFVDYMAEHLTYNGRAGIIVPEGIIFQSQAAYQQLRKLLVEKHLAAVISLPAGVFQPYSGVKTSILILDNALARRRESIAFFKVKSDGYDLGAQRRPIEQNDLPQVTQAVKEWQVMNADELEKEPSSSSFILPKLLGEGMALIVKKSAIAATGDYNLSQERYKQTTRIQSQYPMVKLGEVASFIRGITFKKSDQLEVPTKISLAVATTKAAQESGIVSDALYHISSQLLKDDRKLIRNGDILISTANSFHLLGRTTHVKEVEIPMSFGAFMTLIRAKDSILDGYLIHCLRTPQAVSFYRKHANTTTNISNLNISSLANLQIPLPPMEVQQSLVEEINSYQYLLDASRQIIENYSPRIPIDPSWPLVQLGEITSARMGETLIKKDMTGFGKPIFSADSSNKPWSYTESTRLSFGKDTIVVGARGTIGSVKFPNIDKFTCTQTTIAVTANSEKIIPAFLYCSLLAFDFRSITEGVGIPMITVANINKINIPLPPLKEQKAIITEIEAEQSLINANHQLIKGFEKKIHTALARIWNDKR